MSFSLSVLEIFIFFFNDKIAVGEQSTLGEDKVAHHSSGMTSDLPGQGNYDSNTISYETAAEEDNIQVWDFQQPLLCVCKVIWLVH